MSYQHSETFANLKNVKEQIADNLTSYQWLSTLDHFIESALDAISDAYPDFLDNFFAKVVAMQVTRPSVKFSRNSKEVMSVHMFNSLTTDGAKKREHQRLMMLNRGVLFGAINCYLRIVRPFMQLHEPTRRINTRKRLFIIQQAKERTTPNLYASTLQVQFWADKAFSFKELIVQKYVRLALVSAKRTYTHVSYQVKLDDIVQVYLLYLSKAIDRCDARQGVLTTFIQTWFYSARAEVQKSVSEEQHSSFEDLISSGAILDSTMPDCKYESLQHVSAVAKTLDPEGVLRYATGIPEFLTRSQLKILSTKLTGAYTNGKKDGSR